MPIREISYGFSTKHPGLLFASLLALCIWWQPLNTVAQSASESSEDSFHCPVTIGTQWTQSGYTYENDVLNTTLWPDGETILKQDGPGKIHHDGALEMKWPWYRKAKGQLTIKGRRLHAEAPPLETHIPAGYGDAGFQSTALVFPSPGCWEVTGMVDQRELTFVTLVVRQDH